MPEDTPTWWGVWTRACKRSPRRRHGALKRQRNAVKTDFKQAKEAQTIHTQGMWWACLEDKQRIEIYRNTEERKEITYNIHGLNPTLCRSNDIHTRWEMLCEMWKANQWEYMIEGRHSLQEQTPKPNQVIGEARQTTSECKPVRYELELI